MKSEKERMCVQCIQWEIFRILVGKRLNNAANKDLIQIPVILSNDFDIEPRACLSDIVYNR